jgi:hypothetical protein
MCHSAENKFPSEFSNFTCRATEFPYGARYNITTQTAFTIGAARHSCNVQSDRFNVLFRLRHGASTGGHNLQ